MGKKYVIVNKSDGPRFLMEGGRYSKEFPDAKKFSKQEVKAIINLIWDSYVESYAEQFVAVADYGLETEKELKIKRRTNGQKEEVSGRENQD